MSLDLLSDLSNFAADEASLAESLLSTEALAGLLLPSQFASLERIVRDI